jgi:hypothetical protein
MSALWPNPDGWSWEYEQSFTENLWGFPEVVVNQARLYFDGYSSVPGGIEVQNLEVEISAPPARIAADKSGGLISKPPNTIREPFLRTLWRARPDLRVAIENRSGSAALPNLNPPGFYQVLLGEAAYRKSETEIAAYRRDQVAMMSWLWLVSDLTIGNTFELQLVPDLADDVWLYGTIAAWEDVSVPAGFFEDCLRVDYRIDYGESICTDENGNETGAFRSETYGHIHYAPDVGPIESFETWIPISELIWGECPPGQEHIGEPFSEGTLQYTGGSPVPVVSTTWGSLRIGYR